MNTMTELDIRTRADLDDILALAKESRGAGQLISCYADMSVAEGFESHGLAHFKAESVGVRGLTGEDTPEREEVDRNLEAVRRVLESPEVRSARGLAIFSAAQRGFLRVFAMEAPFENRLVLHAEPYLAPLLASALQRREYLVVLTDTHHARLYAASTGAERLLDELEEDIPQKQKASGERWGKEQATIARHRENEIMHFEKQVAEAVRKHWSSGAYQGIALLGRHELTADFRKRLPESLSDRVVHEAAWNWRSSDVEIPKKIAEVVEAVRQADQEKALAEFKQRTAKEHYAVAVGAAAVVDALQSGRVSPKAEGGEILLTNDPGETVGRCSSCRRLSTDLPKSCPKCGGAMQEANLWEELLMICLRHKIPVHFVGQSKELQRHGGVAAFLTR